VLVSFSFSSCRQTGEEKWDRPVFWVLHEAGTIALSDDDVPPDEPAPAGDQWVRPEVFRCKKCGTEFVGYHKWSRRTANGGLENLIAKPGGEWIVREDDDPREYEISNTNLKCPKCGAGKRDLIKITPRTAKTFGKDLGGTD
jgi:hypothetical protein